MTIKQLRKKIEEIVMPIDEGRGKGKIDRQLLLRRTGQCITVDLLLKLCQDYCDGVIREVRRIVDDAGYTSLEQVILVRKLLRAEQRGRNRRKV